MNIKERINNTVQNLKSLDLETIKAIKYICLVLLIADLLGLYYYLGLKTIGIALFMVLAVVSAVVIMAEKSKKNTEEGEKILKEAGAKKDEKGEWDLGLPDAEEYQERLKKAVGKEYF